MGQQQSKLATKQVVRCWGQSSHSCKFKLDDRYLLKSGPYESMLKSAVHSQQRTFWKPVS